MELAGLSRDEPLLDGEFARPRVTRSGSALSAVADRVTDNEYNANHESTFALVFTYFKTGTANFLGSFVVFGRMILNSDTIVGCLVAVFAVAYFHNTYPSYKPSHLSWSVVSMAIIFPISHGITMSFGRREKAGASSVACSATFGPFMVPYIAGQCLRRTALDLCECLTILKTRHEPRQTSVSSSLHF